MGCKVDKLPSENETVLQPVPVKDPERVITQEPVKLSVEDSNTPERKKKTTEQITSSNDEDYAKNTVVVSQDDKTVITDNDYIEIKVADPKAFNTSFVKHRQQAIDNHSYHSVIDSWRPNSLEQLVEIIEEFSKGKSLIDRHWMIFYWIVHNIEFDTVSYFSKDSKDQTADEVFRTKQGLCTGYSNLYKYVCDHLDMTNQIVRGCSKLYGFDNRENQSLETDHIWNAIKIDDHWYLIEPTWGAGLVTEYKIFKQELRSYYFCPRPNEMIYHHLPNDKQWQLLQKPIKMSQYLQMPKIYPTYFDLNLELISPDHQAYIDLLPNKSYALVLLRAPSNVILLADMKLNNQKIDNSHRVIFDHQQQLYRCCFAPTNIGQHKITIYGKRNDTEKGTFNATLDLTLDVKEMPKKPISYPTIWKSFSDLGLEVLSPRDTHLIKILNGTTHAKILIRTPDNVVLVGRLENDKAEKITAGTLVYYDKNKQFWHCEFAPNCDGMFQAIIMGKKKSDTGDYSPVVSFKIEAKQIPIPSLSYPKTWQLFYDLDMKVEAPRDRARIVLPENEYEVQIHIEAPDNVKLLGRLVNSRQKIVEGGYQVFYDRHKQFWRCKFAPNRNGIFNAEIMAKKKSSTHNFSDAILFQIEAKQVSTSYLSYPFTWQLFHDFDLQITAPKGSASAAWNKNASFTEIRIRAPNDVQLSCNIEYDDIQIENGTLAQFDHDKQEWQLLFAPQRTGSHKLAVYAERQLDTKMLSGAVAQFSLNVTKLTKSIKFPLTYSTFQFYKCQIYEPLDGILKKGSRVPIHCVIPRANEVKLKVDSNWIDIKGYKDPILQTDVTVGSKNVIIYANYGQKANYDGLIQYSVQ